MPGFLVSGKDFLPGLQMALFFLCPHITSSLCSWGEGEEEEEEEKGGEGEEE